MMLHFKIKITNVYIHEDKGEKGKGKVNSQVSDDDEYSEYFYFKNTVI